MLGCGRGTTSFQIHDQKGHIGSDITATELVVELETVENTRPVVEAVDIAGLQIAMAVTDMPSGNAGRQQWPSTVQITPDPAHYVVVRTRLEDGSYEWRDGEHVGFELSHYGFDRGRLRNQIRSISPGMKTGQGVSYRS